MAGVLALAAMTASTSARAGDGFPFLVSVEGSNLFWRPPDLALNGSGVSRRLVGLPVASDGRMKAISAGLHLSGSDRFDPDKVTFGIDAHFLTVRYAWSESTGPTAATANGEPVSVSRSNENLLEVSLPGTGGFFLAYDHFMFRANVDVGFAFLWSQASASSSLVGPVSGAVNGGSSFYLHTPIAGCFLMRAYDGKGRPESACLTVTPDILEFGPMTGVSLGVRVDL